MLVERDVELAVLRTALEEAAGGRGRAVAVSGESGSGKSVLLETAVGSWPLNRVLRGSCDPLGTPRPLGPFRDVAAALGVKEVLTDEDVPLAEVCERLYDALTQQPTVLVVEDAHWIDTASVDVLRFLARRLDAMPLALLVSYRDEEIGVRHLARPLLGDFAGLDRLDTIRLSPLTVDGVRALLADTELLADQVHARTGGNAFFVTEVAKEPHRPLPATVRDAVLARIADLGPDDVVTMQLLATAPEGLEDRLLAALGIDLPALQRLDGTGLLARREGGLGFRHELARQAMESTTPPGGAARMHQRLLTALERARASDPAVLTHHAVAAGDASKAATYARQAAAEAIRAGSHTEAAAFFQTALDHLDATAAPEQRARLLQGLAFELYMTSRLPEAIATASGAFPLWRRAGDADGLAAAHSSVAVYEYYDGRRAQAEAHAERAAVIAREEGSELELGRARAIRGYLAYMRGEHKLAVDCYREAGRIAETRGDQELALRCSLMLADIALADGDHQARRQVLAYIEQARGLGLDELASTGYSHLCYVDVEQRRLRSARHLLEESIPFAVARDIPICTYWQTGARARLHLTHGRWSAAVEDADRVLGGDGMTVATLWPHLVRGLVALRQGSHEDDDAIEAAWQLVLQLDEPVRRLAVLAALAERAWMTERADDRVTKLARHEVTRLAGAPGADWAIGELACWLARLGLLDEPAVPCAEPFRLTLTGRHDEAAAWWHAAGAVFAEALAWADSTDPGRRVRGVELLDRNGATGTADRLRVALRRDGVTAVPSRPRGSTRANPGGLTNRQLEVAQLIARGFTNLEIASRLYISPKTADHHVSAVLNKLGHASRRTVMLHADELGLA